MIVSPPPPRRSTSRARRPPPAVVTTAVATRTASARLRLTRRAPSGRSARPRRAPRASASLPSAGSPRSRKAPFARRAARPRDASIPEHRHAQLVLDPQQETREAQAAVTLYFFERSTRRRLPPAGHRRGARRGDGVETPRAILS